MSTIDLFPTILALAGEADPAAAAALPLDGRDILPVLLGREAGSRSDLILFFDGVHMQAARSGRWKIHFSRWDIPRYTAASSQQRNVRLPSPELYDMQIDPSESYDVAPGHPNVVRNLASRVVAALSTFPEEIRRANAALIASAAASHRPKFPYIPADDLGYGDIGALGSRLAAFPFEIRGERRASARSN